MNCFGRYFKVCVFGESHGPSVGVVVDGCPPGIALSVEDFKKDLLRRRGGKLGTTSRVELDEPLIKSGVFKGKTTGTPIMIEFMNKNVSSDDYDELKYTPRPGHADFVAQKKYLGFQDYRGGGHFSGRITVGLVAAGVIAKKIIAPVKIRSYIEEIGGHRTNYQQLLHRAISEGDSLGAVLKCIARNVPVGLGEPFFDSVESMISHAIFSIPGVKGIEFGAGFECARMKGSEYNDPIVSISGKTITNNAGGINGGITNGNDLVFRIAVRPAASISKVQQTVDLRNGKIVNISVTGRHDCCIAIRFPPIVEAMTAIVLADFFIASKLIMGDSKYE